MSYERVQRVLWGRSGGGLGVSGEHGGDYNEVTIIPRNRSSSDDTGDLKGEEEKAGPPIAATSTVQEKEYRLTNWAKTKPAQATADSAAAAAAACCLVVCCLPFLCFVFALLV